MGGRVDRIRYKEGDERCDICQKDDGMVGEAEALQQAYIHKDQLIETIQAFALHPSMERSSLRFTIYEDRQVAKGKVERVATVMYTDGSKRNGAVGIAVVWRTKDLPALGL